MSPLRPNRLVPASFLALVLAASGASAQDCLDYVEYLHFEGAAPLGGGSSEDIDIAGSLAVVAVSFPAGIRVVDVANPASPQLIGSASAPGVGSTKVIELVGNHAILGVGWGPPRGLRVFDVTNPEAPVLANSLGTLGVPLDLAVFGNLLCAALDTGGLGVFDLSILPVLPQLSQRATPASAGGVAVHERDGIPYAFVAAGYLVVFDLSNTSDPVEVARSLIIGGIRSIAVDDSYVYAAGNNDVKFGHNGFYVFDVTIPSAPVLVGQIMLQQGGWDLEVNGSYVYMRRLNDITIIDVSVPTAPAIVSSSVTLSSSDSRIAAQGSYLYFGNSSLFTVDVDPPTPEPAIAGQVTTPGNCTNAAVAGSHAYVADGSAGLQVIDVSDPQAAVIVGNANTFATDVAVSGSLAGVVGGGSLKLIDVTNPALPEILGSASAPNGFRVTLAGSFAYVLDTTKLTLFDISNPAAPVAAGVLDTPGRPRAVTVAGSHAFVADDYAGLQVVDVSNPATPNIIGTFDTPGAYDVALAGGLAYVADIPDGLLVLDVTTPTLPVLIGSLVTPGGAGRIVLDGARAYVNRHVIDISVPNAPRFLGMIAGTADAVGSHVYLANGDLKIAYRQCGDAAAIPTDGGIPETPAVAPLAAFAGPARPFPATDMARIPMILSANGRVRLTVYDAAGRMVRSLMDESLHRGTHWATWDGRNEAGVTAANGLYFVRLSGPRGEVSTARVALVR